MSLYKQGLGIVKVGSSLPASEKQSSVPNWVGPLAITVIGGLIVAAFSNSKGPQTYPRRAESMWVKR